MRVEGELDDRDSYVRYPRVDVAGGLDDVAGLSDDGELHRSLRSASAALRDSQVRTSRSYVVGWDGAGRVRSGSALTDLLRSSEPPSIL